MTRAKSPLFWLPLLFLWALAFGPVEHTLAAVHTDITTETVSQHSGKLDNISEADKVRCS